MLKSSIEIKMALMGYVSVGKSTLLNALLLDKFSEVSMRRTTAGINHFRVEMPPPPAVGAVNEDGSIASTDPGAVNWPPETGREERTAASTHAEIKEDNAVLRQSNEIHEKFFDVELEESLFDMHPDAKLVIIDHPGHNEAGSGGKYRDYIESKWDTYDCVVVVMDASQGVNTEEHVKLLEMVKKLNETKRNLPTIVLCNKVDDPDDEELAELVSDVRSKVETLFGVSSRESAIDRILKGQEPRLGALERKDVFPIFLPVSAAKACLYRVCHHLDLDQFKKLDYKLICQIGKDAVGSIKWKRLNKEQKYTTAFQAVQNKEVYNDELDHTNFDNFLKILGFSVGGVDAQKELIEQQIEVSLRNLDWKVDLIDQLSAMMDRCKVIGRSKASFFDTFEEQFKHLLEDALASFRKSLRLDGLHGAMDQVHRYLANLHTRLVAMGWDEGDVRSRAMQLMASIVESQVSIILEMAFQWEMKNSAVMGTKIVEGKSLTWQGLTPHDWSTIAGSILLLSYDPYFCKAFGPGKVKLERIQSSANQWLEAHPMQAQQANHSLRASVENWSSTTEAHQKQRLAECLSGSYIKGRFVPRDRKKYDLAVQIMMPKDLSDPEHWGHLAWKYCECMHKHDIYDDSTKNKKGSGHKMVQHDDDNDNDEKMMMTTTTTDGPPGSCSKIAKQTSTHGREQVEII